MSAPVKVAPAPAAPKPTSYRTTGEFMLIDPITKIEFDPGVPTESPLSAFVERRVKLGHLELVK